MTIKLQVLSLFFLFLSCSSPSNHAENVSLNIISQDLPSQASILNLSKFYTFDRLIKLQSNDSSIIDYINKVLVDDDLVFIKGGNSLFKFKLNGDFQKKLTKGIGGPDEYVNLTDVLILPEQDRLWLYDSNQRSIFQFNYDFELEIDYSLNYPLFGVEKLEKGLIGTSGYLEVLDNFSSLYSIVGENLATGFALSKNHLKFNPEKARYLHVYRHDFFSKGPIGYNFVNSFNDTIYYVSENMEVFPKYYIDFGSNKVNENELIGRDYSSIVDVFQYINSSDKSYNVGNVVEFERYLLYKFFNQGIPFVSVYDKSEKILKSGRKISFDYLGQDVVLELDEEISFGTLGNNRAYLVIPSEASILREYQVLFQVKDGDNPIILFFDEK
ncbi:6-bladed beta-propeller [Algoriphagus boritolerans]|uniref:6-bladed beta-propeller protein n=1 Tax=Algoriphagus boritolerans DSM 17298 = JCM 18970 TaxID=1120964 RepID=A0A1H5Z5R4_9BACT|nr:6-bladed beta-propeller [Algoriphagus boritolerans]SEG31005.1 hypothetical protein SAMN03080598_03314 [Algoriphagus boritolerans DSM 17298 = JCM 18970]